MTVKSAVIALAPTLLALSSAISSAASIQFTGHTDIRFIYDGDSNTARQDYHLTEGANVDGTAIPTDTVYLPDELITFIPNPPQYRPTDPFWDFLGVGPGDPLWYIPLSGSEFRSRPWTGFSTESLNPAEFSSVDFALTAFEGPGEMMMLDFSAFGEVLLDFQTGDGLDDSDKITMPIGGHSHYQWYFTQPGKYQFDLTATGYFTTAAGGGAVSSTDTFTFHVVIPEPNSAVLVGFASLLVALCRRPSRRPGSYSYPQ